MMKEKKERREIGKSLGFFFLFPEIIQNLLRLRGENQ